MKKLVTIPALLLAVSVCSAAAFAAGPDSEGPGGGGPGAGGPGGHRPPGPPPEALAVCKGKTAGAAVTLATPDGRNVSGTCQLVFNPEPPAGGDRQGGGNQGGGQQRQGKSGKQQ